MVFLLMCETGGYLLSCRFLLEAENFGTVEITQDVTVSAPHLRTENVSPQPDQCGLSFAIVLFEKYFQKSPFAKKIRTTKKTAELHLFDGVH